ncbi:hypothetical protein ADL15_00790 [Actinoplanes awajinensis subsp. mycoplanecinus]|uniref:Secreted protein n=2 Tax=Actinoplanes awajinensis TaxID=135946 RepID=A0A0X3VCH6_9ACTN|nr:hypothetical protein ADL15_00790 [Actinoplanes awajinensis subsp. mycoplanecinus]
MVIGLTAVAIGPGPASAAAAFAAIDASSFVLDPSDSFQRYGDIISRIEASGKVTPAASLGSALDGTQDFKPTWGLCHTPTGFPTTLDAKGFCWDPRDDGWGLTWTPQGISGSWDAQPNGIWQDRKIAVASWHGPNDAFSRLTFVDYTDTSKLKFRDVLLVVPTTTGGVDNFRTLEWNHADGVVWYGNTLLVADGGQLHAFSLRHLWATTRSEEEVGFGADGSAAPSGRWHRYVLPQVGEYFTGDAAGCNPITGIRLCLNALSLDRRGASPDSMVSAEYVSKDSPVRAGGRAIRWPISSATALPTLSADGKVHAEEAFSSPIWSMQGIASDGANWFIAGVCAAVDRGCLHKAVPGQSPHQQAVIGGLENLSYQPSYNGSQPRLWGATEGDDPITFNISVP